MDRALNLGRVFGIQFRLHYTWFIIFILITASLSWQLFPDIYPGWPLPLYWVIGVIASLLFFTSVLAHELAHSLVGKANGVPIKSITLFIFGGVAQMIKEAARPGAEFKMAVAGPASSLIIGGLFGLLYLFTRGVFEPVAAIAYWLAYVNVILAVFNLIPGFPLDGGRVFRSILWRVTDDYKRSTRIAARVGQGVGYLFILGGILMMFIFRDWFSGLWLAFIGWFLERAASASYRQIQWRGALGGVTVSQAMTSDCPVVSQTATVDQLAQQGVFLSGYSCFLVAEEGRLLGVLSLHNVGAVSRSRWGETQVKEIMIPVDKLKVVCPEQDALSTLEQMGEGNVNQMPVVSEGRIVGFVVRDNLMKFIHTRSQSGM